MLQLFIAYQPLVDLFLLHSGLALAQYLVLRAGVFSIANAGLTAIGAYLSAWLTLKAGLHPALSVVAGAVAGMAVAVLLSLPLARLRGVYQAIATLAFVQIVVSLCLYFDTLTGGPQGFNNIPKLVQTWHLVLAVVVVSTPLHAQAWWTQSLAAPWLTDAVASILPALSVEWGRLLPST